MAIIYLQYKHLLTHRPPHPLLNTMSPGAQEIAAFSPPLLILITVCYYIAVVFLEHTPHIGVGRQRCGINKWQTQENIPGGGRGVEKN